MATAIDVYNLALTNLGVGTEVATVTERSTEAKAISRVFDTCVDEVLRSFDWPFATKNVELAVVTEIEDDNHPTTEFDFSYRYPSTCLKARRILSEIRNDSRKSRVTYREMGDDQGTLIVTDKEDAVLEFTSNIGREPSRWSADFVTALAFLISSRVAPRLTKGDPFKLGDKMLGFYMRSIRIARANSADEEQEDEAPESDSILVRY